MCSLTYSGIISFSPSGEDDSFFRVGNNLYYIAILGKMLLYHFVDHNKMIDKDIMKKKSSQKIKTHQPKIGDKA